MGQLLQLQVDDNQLESMIRDELQNRLKQLEHRHTFWDMNELERQTCMSRSFILDRLFYHPDFPKFKIGQKWLMPARETEEFLLMWLREQAER